MTAPEVATPGVATLGVALLGVANAAAAEAAKPILGRTLAACRNSKKLMGLD